MVSGIGCSSRIPYYVDTYGFHGIHGRACAIASGVKLANPSLSVWINMGDGDSMAIGGNHLIHIVRRNLDVNITIFNNQIYGLTKGQYSPTTKFGQITKTSPYGTIDYPFNPAELIMGAQGTFYARALDVNPKLTTDIMLQAAEHYGTSVVEVLQNCVIFNDKTHAAITDREVRDDKTILLEHGKPMIFGKNRDKGIRFNGTSLEVVTLGENGITEKEYFILAPNSDEFFKTYDEDEYREIAYENDYYEDSRGNKKRRTLEERRDNLDSIYASDYMRDEISYFKTRYRSDKLVRQEALQAIRDTWDVGVFDDDDAIDPWVFEEEYEFEEEWQDYVRREEYLKKQK